MIATFEQLFLGVLGFFFLGTFLFPLIGVLWSFVMSFINSFDR